jgi:hypothetical protein
VTHDVNDLEPVGVELMPETAKFVELAARGYDPADAAQLAGFDRSESRTLLRHARVQEAIHNEARGLAAGRLLPLALRALTRLMEDPTTPPVLLARVAAQLIAQGGLIRPPASAIPTDTETNPDLSLNDMTPEQLAERKRSLNALLTFDPSANAPKGQRKQGITADRV